MLLLETVIGVGGGLGGVVGGFWAQSEGFFQPLVSTSFMSVATLMLLPLLPDSRKINAEIVAERQKYVATSGTNESSTDPTENNKEEKSEKRLFVVQQQRL